MTEEPNDPYLWDRTGEPDPLVASLERKLSPLALGAPGARRRPARRGEHFPRGASRPRRGRGPPRRAAVPAAPPR